MTLTAAEARKPAVPEPVAMPPGETLASLFQAQACRTPHATALVCGTERIGYASLQDRATRLARSLGALGIGRGTIVLLALPRTPDLVIAVLAAHKAGAAYLPLDPSFPAERQAWIIADSEAPVVLTTRALASSLVGQAIRIVRLDVPGDAPDAPDQILWPPDPADLAYVLYTSGSTGLPKAVGVEHRNAVNLVRWGRWLLNDVDLSGFLFSTSVSFDLSVFEIFVPLSFGGRVILVENLLALPAAPMRSDVRVVNTVPSLLAGLLTTDGLPGSVRTVIVAGEALTRGLADRLFTALPEIRLLNLYGPTEATVYATWAEIRPGESGAPPIGRGVWNTALYVLDSERQPVAPGAEGELWIGGAGVARGYLNRQELSAERFVANPFGPGRLYRTGDRVRWRTDGMLEFFGRLDDQIKINGLRVEPGEIETALQRQPGVASAAVMLHRDSAGLQRLVAWLTATPGLIRPDQDELRRAMARLLPSYMVPAYFGWLESLPLTPNGKLDRRALPPPPDTLPSVTAYRAPATLLEQQVASVWQDVLRLEGIGAETDFFLLGGDSLAAISMFLLLEERFGVRLTAAQLAGGSMTVARLATHIGCQTIDVQTAGVIALQPLGTQRPFFCVPGIGGDVLHLWALAQHMSDADRPFLALRGGIEADSSIKSIASRYAAAMIERQPEGPFTLGGYSAGATIAFEMAHQLRALGHTVKLLVLIDARSPGWTPNLANAPRIALNFVRNLPAWFRYDLMHSGVRQMLRDLRRKLRRRPGGAANVESVVDLSHYPATMQEVMRITYKALLAYQGLPWIGRVTLLRARAQPLLRLHDELALGWSTLVPLGVIVRTLPGNHHTILHEPHVLALACALRESLAAAEGRSQKAGGSSCRENKREKVDRCC